MGIEAAPAVARRGPFPCGPTPLLQRGPETTAALLRGQAVRRWTRPSDRASSYGTYGQGMDKCKALAHPLPTLAALAPTASPLPQQRFIEKATSSAPDPSRIVPSSQAIRRRNSPAKHRGVPTRECGKQHRSLTRASLRRACAVVPFRHEAPRNGASGGPNSSRASVGMSCSNVPRSGCGSSSGATVRGTIRERGGR